MDEATYQKIKDWISENHDHHGTVDDNYESDDDWFSSENSDDTICVDGDYPYVNSMSLEGFIDSLVDPTWAASYQYKGRAK